MFVDHNVRRCEPLVSAGPNAAEANVTLPGTEGPRCKPDININGRTSILPHLDKSADRPQGAIHNLCGKMPRGVQGNAAGPMVMHHSA